MSNGPDSEPGVIREIPSISDLVDSHPIVLAGDALQLVDDLTNELRNVESREEVVMRALGLLQAARNKDVVLKDRSSGASEVVRLWR